MEMGKKSESWGHSNPHTPSFLPPGAVSSIPKMRGSGLQHLPLDLKTDSRNIAGGTAYFNIANLLPGALWAEQLRAYLPWNECRMPFLKRNWRLLIRRRTRVFFASSRSLPCPLSVLQCSGGPGPEQPVRVYAERQAILSVDKKRS